MKMTAASDFEISYPTEIDIIMTRTFKAPRALVFRLWSEREHIMRWWGPAGFENLKCEMDFRVGGRFFIEMAAPDGTIYPCEGLYTEIIPDERIVYQGASHIEHPCGAGLPPHAIVTVTFRNEGGHTRLSLHAKMISAEATRAAIEGGFSVGWEQGFERLLDHIQSQEGI